MHAMIADPLISFCCRYVGAVCAVMTAFSALGSALGGDVQDWCRDLAPMLTGVVAAALLPCRTGTWDRCYAVLAVSLAAAIAGVVHARPAVRAAIRVYSATNNPQALTALVASAEGVAAVVMAIALGVTFWRWLGTKPKVPPARDRTYAEAVLDWAGRKNRVLVIAGYLLLMQVGVVTISQLLHPLAMELVTAWFVCGPAITATVVAAGASHTEKCRLLLAGAVFFLLAVAIVVMPLVAASSFNGALVNSHLGALDPIVVTSAGIGLLCIVTLGLALSKGDAAFKRPKRGVLGDADFMDMADAQRLFPPTGWVVIGEAYRPDLERKGDQNFLPRDRSTWGSGGTAPLLCYDMSFGSTHMLFFAGSGGYKTTSTVIPTALRYPGSMVILDPAQEIGDMVSAHRRKMANAKGQPRKVVILDPDLPDVPGFDVLELFREMTFKRQTMIVGGYAKMLLDEKIKSQSSADQYFEQNCEKLATGLLMYALYGQLTKLDPSLEGTPGPHAAMIKHYAMLALKPEDELQELIKLIIKNTGDPLASGYIARDDARQFIKFQLGAFSGMDSKQWSSIASSLSGPVGWMSKPPFVEMLCGTTFSLREFAGGNMDVFIQLSSNILQENRGLVRLLIGAMLKTQMDGGFKVPEIPTLYMLDEVDALGYMSALTEARDRGRKFGIALALLYQSEGQLKLHFGEDSFGAWFDTAALRSYALVSQNKVAKELSEAIGEATAVIENRSSSSSWADALLGKNLASSSRVTTSENLQKRALMFSWDILKMRSDAQLVLVASQPALLCGRSIFFRRPEMLAMTEQSRVRSGAGREDADLEPITRPVGAALGTLPATDAPTKPTRPASVTAAATNNAEADGLGALTARMSIGPPPGRLFASAENHPATSTAARTAAGATAVSESHSAVVETMSTAEVIVVLSATLAVETAPPPTSQPPVTADQASSVTTPDKAAMSTQGIQLNLPPGRLPMPLAFGTSEDYLNEFVSAAPLEGNRGDQ